MTPPDPTPFLRAIGENPADDLPRLVYADWLEEHAGTEEVPCAKCAGRRHLGAPAPGQRGWIGAPPCPECGGEGSRRVSNGNAERAEFIRDSVTMGQYTDCPVRLADVKRGRPVPLRCGECEYCQARRRCETFHHEWIPGVAHSYILETCPLDSEFAQPDHGGLHATIRRGFVHTVRGPLASLLGICGRCDGRKWLSAETHHYHCPDCHGTGRTPGALERMGGELWCVEVATPTDREPESFEDGIIWNRDMRDINPAWEHLEDERSILPGDLFDAMAGEGYTYYFTLNKHGCKRYASHANALAALSDTILAAARGRAGLAEAGATA